MSLSITMRRVSLCLLTTLAASCSGDPTGPGSTTSPNFVRLQSDPGDYIGGGRSYEYSQANALLTVTAVEGHLGLRVSGDQSWTADFQSPSGMTELRTGTYSGLTRYPFNDPVKGGLSWSGEGRGCNQLTASLTIDDVSYDGNILRSIDLHFEQHCEGAGAALHGTIHWRADDLTTPPGPVTPIPATLWQPAAGATPAGRNFVYLQSDLGDYIGGGQTVTLTQADAIISVTTTGRHLTIGATGWGGDFMAMAPLSELQQGYYAGLQRYEFSNPVKGGFEWRGPGRSCNTITGWFAIDGVAYTGGALTAIDLRFEQHCDGAGAALHGKIHWRSDDTTAPPGPVVPVPASLWKPSAGAVPTDRNYVYLQSDAGDFIGGGQTSTYTQATAVLTAAMSGGRFTMGTAGWNGNFQAMSSISRLQAGYYGNLTRYPFHNPVKGGLDWSGNGRGCNTLTGWFAVDSITYNGSSLTQIDVRFEQHCEGASAALRGAIHWRADDPTAPPGPVLPMPAGLWKPAAGATPTDRNYVHLQSDAGDYVGGGQTSTVTQADAIISVTTTGARLAVSATGWNGNFQGMSVISTLQPGYYGDLSRYPFHNPVKGGLDWSGNGRGCNTLTGWFAIDSVTYTGSTLTQIDLRFEQHCEGMGPALHGAIHWRAGDPTAPPGPVLPIPAGLWQPPAGSTPATGSSVYLASDAGDWIGAGQTYSYAAPAASITVTASGGYLQVRVGGWNGDFQAMNSISKIEPGYYGNLTRYPFHNPVKGGISWYGNGRACNTITGWFAVDRVVYANGVLTALDLRFEQHCEGGTTALHGVVHWGG